MKTAQPGILPPIPAHARYLEFSTVHDQDSPAALAGLTGIVVDESLVIGIGPALIRQAGGKVAGHRGFAALSGNGVEIPSTQADLWVWLRGSDRGQILHAARRLEGALAPAFARRHITDGFRYEGGLDLSGYEDGTENPEGQAAIDAAFAPPGKPGMAGSSFVAVQMWQHDLSHFAALGRSTCDDIIGRRQSDNEELSEAPLSAHVKRTAQESFSPEAFLLRRSMPWADCRGEGLNFVAFGRSFDAFEAQLRRMVGLDDGITDGLFRFSRPLSGGYYWCPPLRRGRLDLTALGL